MGRNPNNDTFRGDIVDDDGSGPHDTLGTDVYALNNGGPRSHMHTFSKGYISGNGCSWSNVNVGSNFAVVIDRSVRVHDGVFGKSRTGLDDSSSHHLDPNPNGCFWSNERIRVNECRKFKIVAPLLVEQMCMPCGVS
jgi:hypothetical protein